MSHLAITETHFRFPKQKNFYKGKVRDVYNINDEILVMIVTDRISAFADSIKKRKNQVLSI